MNKFVVLACVDANGSSVMVGYDVECSRSQYDEGEHIDLAIEMAEKDGYEGVNGQFIAFDDGDQSSITHIAETIREKEHQYKQSIIQVQANPLSL